jgi:hypothetical protein
MPSDRTSGEITRKIILLVPPLTRFCEHARAAYDGRARLTRRNLRGVGFGCRLPMPMRWIGTLTSPDSADRSPRRPQARVRWPSVPPFPLPKRQQEETRWQHVTAQLLKAAERGGGWPFFARLAFSRALHGVSGVEPPPAPRDKNADWKAKRAQRKR